jgi:iron(III) transport system substrate-binding protein
MRKTSPPGRATAAMLALALCLVAVACGGSSPPRAGSAASGGPATGAGQPAGAGGASGAQPAASSGDAGASWDAVVAAAKQEGKVVVYGPEGADMRAALTRGFQQRYPDIQIEFSGMAGAQVAPKLLGEREAGLNIVDIVIVGPTTIMETLMPAGALVPLQPYLVGPSTQDPTKWRGGRFEYADNAQQYHLVFIAYPTPAVHLNTNKVAVDQITSWRDLLDPKWKGQIVMKDPLIAGAGLALVTFWYRSDELGPEYMRQLFAQQDVTMLKDDRQLVDALGQGRYAIGLSLQNPLAFELRKKGLPLGIIGGERLQEGTYLTSGTGGGVSVVDRAPHPNAAKVYIDYLLSPEGQRRYTEGTGLPSHRTDVSTDGVPPEYLPQPGGKYMPNYDQPSIEVRGEVRAFVEPLIKR